MAHFFHATQDTRLRCMKELLSLTHDGVEMVDYPNTLKQTVANAAAAWQDFLSLPDATKQHYMATTLQSGTGYEKKGNGERESHDIKENFNITRASLADLQAINARNAPATQFIEAAGALFDKLERFIAMHGDRTEQLYGITGFGSEARDSAASAFIRFLYYPPVPAGTVIGEPHVDHSGFTFHLHESTDGCDRLDPVTHEWLPIPVGKHQAAMFAGMQTQLFSHSEITGLCHRIMANSTTAKIGRTAIVCFVPLVNTPSYDRATHGRLQERTPGFNYTMSDGEFARLFRDIQSR